MKHINYEECFAVQKWIGFIRFTKNRGVDFTIPYIHASSIITIENSTTCYHEQFDYVMFQHKVPSLIIHHFWKKNKDIIMPQQIPPELFQYIAQKRPSDTIYSSHPHHL
jgi:hypothetical protein